MIGEFQERFLVEHSVEEETLRVLESERRELTKELVINFSESLTGGDVLDFHRVSETLGISEQLTTHIQENIWNKLGWGDNDIHTGGGFNMAHFLLLNGDAGVFSTVCNSEQELLSKGLISSDVGELLSAYANSGKEEEVLNFIKTSEMIRDQEFWLSLFSLLNPNNCPELTSFVFKNIEKSSLAIEFKNNEAIIFLIKAGNSEALNIFQNTINELDDGESKTLFLHILLKSSNKEFNLELFELFIKIIEKGNFEHDDYELSFNFLEKIIMKIEGNSPLKDKIISWVNVDDWQNDEIKRFTFSLLYIYHQDDEEACSVFEDGMREWFSATNADNDPQRVSFWSILVSKLGFQHNFLQELFNGFEKDKGIFEEEWSEEKLSQLSMPLIGQGMFREIEQIISEKVSHKDSTTYLSNRFSKTGEEFEIDEYSEKDILGKADDIYDPVWTKRSLSEVKKRLTGYIEKVKSLTREKSFYSRKLYKVGLDSYGLLNPRLLDIFSGKTMFIDMKKTGSALYILTGKNLGILVNEVPDESFVNWDMVHQAGIPVAPIVKSEDKFRNKVILGHDRSDGLKELRRVYSRYCGLSAREYLIMTGDPNTILSVQDDMDRIKKQLEELGVDHGHPHIDNFTVEFWDKSVLFEAKENGININDIVPVNEGDLTFDIDEVSKNPGNWIRVVRLIDWDNSSSKES